MPLIHKRRPTAELQSLQTTVLSAFDDPACSQSDPPSHVAKRSKRSRRHPSSRKLASVNNLCEDLCCVSTDDGQSGLARLKQSLQTRSYGLAELATHLFICDEVDTGPPLCAAVHLLQARVIHIKDIRPASLLDRAILELRNPATCLCRGQRNGVQGVIRFILEDSHSSERDNFVQHFLSILFQGAESISSMPHKRERFRLAEHILRALRERNDQHDEDTSKLHEWVRRASLPTKAIAGDRDKSNSDIWTAELSGLATGRSPREYLTYGKAEESALINLFKVLPPVSASRIYLECVHSVFRTTTTSPRLPPRAVGCWSRVVILGHRVLDSTSFVDADADLRRGMQSSLNGILTSALSLNERHEVAVLLCLIRSILVLGGPSEDSSATSKDLKHYELWLKDFVARNHDSALLTTLKVLTELIPLEPLKFLRVNHKVLSLRRENANLAAAYLISLRVRISDLDPTRSERFLTSKNEDVRGVGSESGNSEKVEEQVMRFVLDYSRFRKIPSALARKMNFHRYYFRTKILKSLLDPHLAQKCDEKPFDGQMMNARSFDECRIDMIKELAFNRNDKAVTAAEANEAIASITAQQDRRSALKDRECFNENTAASVVTESSSVQEIFKAIFEEYQVRSSSSDIPSVTTNAGFPKGVNILLKKMEEGLKPTKNPIQGPEQAAELLHGIASALEETGRSSYPEIFGYMFDSTSDSVLRAYAAWWKSQGIALLETLRHLLEGPTGRKIQKCLQYQLLALLCAAEAHITRESAISLAMLVMGLAKVGETSALMDIVMISKCSSRGSFSDALSKIIACLPLMRADTVTTSVMFALHGICLFVTLPDFLSISSGKTRSDKNDSASIKDEKVSFDTSPAYRGMLDLLRWVSCYPWRLSSFPDDEFLSSNVMMPRDAISAITFISRLLVSDKVPIPHDFTIEQYVHIEQRCAWGRVGSVYEELKKREFAGTHPTRLVCQFTLFLAKRCSRRWPSVSWMEQGMMRYAEETISCRALEASSHMDSFDVPRFFERSVNAYGRDVGYRLLDFYSRTRCCYFHKYSGVDIEQHFASTLVPWYWPFPSQLVDYLWDCLHTCCSSWESCQNSIKDNFLLISNFALHGRLKGDQVRDVNGMSRRTLRMEAASDDMVSKRRELRKAMEELSAFDCGTSDDFRTQVVIQSMSPPLLPAVLAKAFGSCVVLGLAKKCQLLDRNSRAERIRAWVDQVATVVDEKSMCEFLGTSLCVASLLPFTRFTEEYERCEDVTEITDDILTQLLEGHLRLLGEGRGPFRWTRMLLPSRAFGCDDMRRNFMVWFGRHVDNDGSEQTCQLECFPVDACMARVYQGMGSLCDESLRRAISKIGHNGLAKCLIPNILNTCRRLGSYNGGTADVNVSKSSHHVMVERRNILIMEMITVVTRLLALAKVTLGSFGDDAVEELVGSYEEFGDQVRSRVTAMDVR